MSESESESENESVLKRERESRGERERRERVCVSEREREQSVPTLQHPEASPPHSANKSRHQSIPAAYEYVVRKVDIRLPGKGNSKTHGARPVH